MNLRNGHLVRDRRSRFSLFAAFCSPRLAYIAVANGGGAMPRKPGKTGSLTLLGWLLASNKDGVKSSRSVPVLSRLFAIFSRFSGILCRFCGFRSILSRLVNSPPFLVIRLGSACQEIPSVFPSQPTLPSSCETRVPDRSETAAPWWPLFRLPADCRSRRDRFILRTACG